MTATNRRLRAVGPTPALHQEQDAWRRLRTLRFRPPLNPHRNAAARVRLMPGWKRKAALPQRSTNLADFIAGVRSFYLATANKDGQPYIQHRGGPPGFLRVLDAKTIAFAEFSGNRQYITTGNLEDNPRAMMFLMDYQLAGG